MTRVHREQFNLVIDLLKDAGWQILPATRSDSPDTNAPTLLVGNVDRYFNSSNEMTDDVDLTWRGGPGAPLQVAFAKHQIVAGVGLHVEAGTLTCYADRVGDSDLCRIINSFTPLKKEGYIAEPCFSTTSTAGWEIIYGQQDEQDARAVFWNIQSHEDCFADDGTLIDDLPMQWSGDPQVIAEALNSSGLDVTMPESTRDTFYISPLGEDESSEYDIDSWAEAIADLHANTAHNSDDARRAHEATANVWSGYGYQDAPIEVQRILINAIEIGYMTALNQVRDGDLDNEIRMWRPMLAEQ